MRCKTIQYETVSVFYVVCLETCPTQDLRMTFLRLGRTTPSLGIGPRGSEKKQDKSLRPVSAIPTICPSPVRPASTNGEGNSHATLPRHESLPAYASCLRERLLPHCVTNLASEFAVVTCGNRETPSTCGEM